MNDALGAKAEAVLGDGCVPGKSAVEIFGGHLRHARSDTRPQRLANIDVLARNAKRHHGLHSLPQAIRPLFVKEMRCPVKPGSGEGRPLRACFRMQRSSRIAFPACAAPMKEFAWTHDISPPFDAQCRCRRHAASPR